MATLALAGLVVSSAAWACPGRQSGFTERFPAIRAYSINRGSDPANERTREEHGASVIGGHATEGSVRFDIWLDAPLATSCRAELDIFDPTLSPSLAAAGQSGQLGLLLDRQGWADSGLADLRGEGTDHIGFDLPVRYNLGMPRTLNLALRLGRDGAPVPFTIELLRHAALQLTLSAAQVRYGERLEATLALPFPANRLSGVRDAPVQFSFSPPSAGILRAAVADHGGTGTLAARGLSTDFAVPQTSVVIVPNYSLNPLTVTLTATLGRDTVSRQFTLAGALKPCAIKANFEPATGGMTMILTNIGEQICPAMALTVSAPVAATGPAQTVPLRSSVATIKSAIPETVTTANTMRTYISLDRVSEAASPAQIPRAPLRGVAVPASSTATVIDRMSRGVYSFDVRFVPPASSGLAPFTITRSVTNGELARMGY